MATPKNARRLVALVAAALAVFPSSACGNGVDADPTGDTVSSAASPTATAKASTSVRPKTSTPVRPKTITSACKLLPASVVVKILGSSRGTTLQAQGDSVVEDGTKMYTCAYRNRGREALSLIATTYPDRAGNATEIIDGVAEGSGVKTTRIDGVGAGAVAYVTDDDTRVLAFAVPYKTELRFAVLSGPSIISQGKMIELAKRVVSRL